MTDQIRVKDSNGEYRLIQAPAQKMHPSNKVTIENLKEVVYWHRPSTEQIEKMEKLAKQSEELMSAILLLVPDCADRSAALRCVREARMWANAAVVLDPNAKAPVDHSRGEGK